MMFVGRYTNRKFPVSRITEVRSVSEKNPHGMSQVQIRFNDEETVLISDASFDDAMENTVQVSFPANGAQLLELIEGDDEHKCEIYKKNVLGFYIDGWGDLRALTVDGAKDDPLILFADGHVERYEERWDSEAAYLADQQARFDQRKLNQAEVQANAR